MTLSLRLRLLSAEVALAWFVHTYREPLEEAAPEVGALGATGTRVFRPAYNTASLACGPFLHAYDTINDDAIPALKLDSSMHQGSFNLV